MPAAAGPARVLAVTRHFNPAYGGTPESLRLLARLLTVAAVSVDVLAAEGLHADVARFERLPDQPGALVPGGPDLAAYGGLLLAGPWNPAMPRLAWRARNLGLGAAYAPKGGLVPVEFAQTRDLKKLPYLALVEAPAIRLCRALVFSSALERDATVLPGWARPRSQPVLAEPFAGPPPPDAPDPPPPWPPFAPAAGGAAPMVVGFLAEIAPRKGLLELVRGFAALHASEPGHAARLAVAGAPRVGAEAYLAEVEAALAPLEAAGLARLVGAQRGPARDAFYRALDLFAAPSRFESFNLTPLEALWQGVPVLAAPQLGVLEFLAADAPLQRLAALDPASVAAGLAAAARCRPELAAKAAALRHVPLPAFGGGDLAAAWRAALLG